jgi:hypothetical protein
MAAFSPIRLLPSPGVSLWPIQVRQDRADLRIHHIALSVPHPETGTAVPPRNSLGQFLKGSSVALVHQFLGCLELLPPC